MTFQSRYRPKDSCPCGSQKQARNCCLNRKNQWNLAPALLNLDRRAIMTQPYSHPKCYMAALKSCSDRITREHYISKTVIEAVAGDENKVMTRGFPFLQDREKLLSEAAMTSKILCQKHNNDLSPLDGTAGRLIRLLQNYQSNALAGNTEKHVEVFCGENLERWALKTLCGFLASGNLIDEANKNYTTNIPLFWLEILGSRVKWPSHWGLYLHSQGGQDNYVHQAFAFQPWFNSVGDVAGARLWLYGVPFYLSLHTPEKPERFGSHLPGRIIFRKAGVEQIIEFGWSRHTALESHIFEHKEDGTGLPPLGRIDSTSDRMSRQAEMFFRERDGGVKNPNEFPTQSPDKRANT